MLEICHGKFKVALHMLGYSSVTHGPATAEDHDIMCILFSRHGPSIRAVLIFPSLLQPVDTSTIIIVKPVGRS